MSTATGNYVQDNSSLANFKNWAQAISNAFSGFGWTQTTDTGQVNWGSIASVPASTYVYEVWKAADALASSMPIYVKVEYGFSATAVNFRMTIGTGSNGSGTITGQGGGPFTCINFSNQGATTFPCYFSGSNCEFRCYMWAPNTPNTGVSGNSCLFAIERSKDSSGSNTADYVTFLHCYNGSSNLASNQHQLTFSATATGRQDTGILGIGGTSQGATGTGFANGTVASAPIFPWFGKLGNPMLGAQTCYDGDVVDQSIVTCASMYGSTHTYIGMRGSSFSLAVGSRALTGSSSMAILMRYE